MTDRPEDDAAQPAQPTGGPRPLSDLLTAVQFLTRVPVYRVFQFDADDFQQGLRRAVVYFPLVGGLIGCSTAAIFLMAIQLGMPVSLAAIVALGWEAALTGAFHEDAFADTWDALGGGWTRDQVLTIMKDSRLGTYGTLALVLGLAARGAAMIAIAEHGWLIAAATIVAAATLARIAIVIMMATTNPVSDRQSQARDISGTQTLGRVAIASLISLPFWTPWFSVSFAHAAGSIVAASMLFLWFRGKILRRVGGTTGDLLGCTGFQTQLVLLLGASVS